MKRLARSFLIITLFTFQLKKVLDHIHKYESISRSSTGSFMCSESTKKIDQEVQTDFPTTLLENYIVMNKRRVLQLLGLPQSCLSNLALEREDFAQVKHVSWNPLPTTKNTYRPKIRSQFSIDSETTLPPPPCLTKPKLQRPKYLPLFESINQNCIKRHSADDSKCLQSWPKAEAKAKTSTVSLEIDDTFMFHNNKKGIKGTSDRTTVTDF